MAKQWKNKILPGAAALGALFVLFAIAVQVRFLADSSATYSAPAFQIREQVQKANVQLGERIYQVRAGCIDCHGAKLDGAKVMDDPAMGTIYGANLTPAGIGAWSDEEVARAIRYGIHPSGRSLRFMPSFDYQGMSLDDMAALVAYLRSVPSVAAPPHPNTFGPVAKTLSFFRQMPVLFPAQSVALDRGFADKPEEGPTAAFGQYLANACTGCHGAEFRGGKIPGGDPAWPEAPGIRLGNDARWTQAAFAQMLASGVSPITGMALRPPMPARQLAQLNATESEALWRYLVSLKH